MVNWILAVCIVLGAIGFVLLMLGTPEMARYGSSLLADLGVGMIVVAACIFVLLAALAAVVYLLA